MGQKLFRQEAVDHQRSYWKGKVILFKGVSPFIISACCIAFMAVLIAMLCFFKFTQRIDVVGEVITLPHPLNISSPQPGFISQQFIQVGDTVKKGDVLFELDVSKSTNAGNVSDTNISMIKAKITNAEEIINKLKANKDDFIATTQRQIQRYEYSLTETDGLLATAKQGLTKMESALQNYNQYLKKGLINKDQYNNQHSLYVQQQNAFQSLSTQKMQLELQLTQSRSDITVKSAELDNQIAAQYNQLSDFQSQLIETNANGKILVKSTIGGRVESVAVTPGQMVDAGSSLAQIKQLTDVKYYLLLWLPDNSLPYVKIGDTVNIRYDAFPSDKFGQFSGKIKSISSMPATRRELAEYNIGQSNTNSAQTLYKAIIDIKQKEFIYKDKKLELSNGLKAKSLVFMEERPLYQWLFSPVYKVAQSLTGPNNE
ncbi:HlyD family secretion protein [Kosakonia oryzae]|uniref:HlyD family secretion protein n=1 Tax=Kosakonia oryzae TaxID=497725 RepID=UPI001D09581F|nr:HlyD family secretion protein [Kosakonia oryzae]UDJ83331.1 HlyD family secretion protein [Kosakonia oryzae]